ncbi:MAG: endo-1,4-beta-xylanase [Hyphomicrobium sp.]
MTRRRGDPRPHCHLDRRALLLHSAAATAALAFGHVQRVEAQPPLNLGALAETKGLLFGASLAVHELDGAHGGQYAALYEQNARILTSELEFKLSTLRATSDKLDFADADRLVDFAGQRRMSVRGHTLIWNDDVPAWIKQLSDGDVGLLLDAHIASVLERYRHRVMFWDVVNEPIGPWDKQPGNLRDGPFYRALGEGYIARAFEKAHAADPNAILVLNEAQTETADETGKTFRDSLLGLLHRLKMQGVPIDAIGLQSHLRLAAKYDFPAFTAFIEEIAALGFDIHITELDVNDTGIDGGEDRRDAAVAAMYRNFLKAVLHVKAVKVVQTWQLSDASSWMQDKPTQARMHIRAHPRPLLFDASFNRKRAFDAVAEAFAEAPAR